MAASGSAMIWELVGGLVRIVIAQMRVGPELAGNRETICSLLRRTAPRDWVVFPEGALTGYFPGELDYLADTGRADVEAAVEKLRAVVARQGCHCLLGTARFAADGWRNSAVLLSPGDEVRWYDKNVLGSLDSRHFVAGDELPVWEVDGVKVGVQICWELLFPQRWTELKRNGAQVVFHLNNAVKPEDAFWEHVLLARAFENRYFVASANNAAAPQTLPSYLIAPSGETLLTGEPRIEQSLSCELVLSQVEPAWS
jgi:predicted amidohydrolase